MNKYHGGDENALFERSALRASWKAWIEKQVELGGNKTEAEAILSIHQLCVLFGVELKDFGIVGLWPDGRPIVTYKTEAVLASLVLALIAERIDNPPALEIFKAAAGN